LQILELRIRQDLQIEKINSEKGMVLGDLLESDLTLDDYMYFLRSMSGKFRNTNFLEKDTVEWNLANATFRVAKENGFSSEKFRSQVEDFVVKFKYTINHWQPDDILKLSEQPRLYPRSWVMRQMKDDPNVWEKLAMYEVGDHVLYAWKWEDVPLKRFVPRKARAESEVRGARGEDSGTRGEESEVVMLISENLKLKIKLDEMLKEKKEFLRKMADLERLVEEMRRKNSEDDESRDEEELGTREE